MVELRYQPLAGMKPWKRNPKRHDVEGIKRSLRRFGFTSPLLLDEKSGRIVAGHGRVEALESMRKAGEQRPARILVDDTTGDWLVPVIRGLSFASEEEAEAYLLADNRLTELGGWDEKLLDEALEDLAAVDEELLLATGFSQKYLEQVLETVKDGVDALASGLESVPKPGTRIDLFFSQTIPFTCCLAVGIGWQYGRQSLRPVCPNTGQRTGRYSHALNFIDNDYHNYDHKAHLEFVAKYHPKYTTVRDYMSKAQCEAEGIAYYPLEQILDWAKELEEVAENVIVIPKVDVIDQIPERYILGLSVPTTYGGTPLPPELFQGRRVHLLGGSWARQLKYLRILREAVVSLDQNAITKMAKFGEYTEPDGQTKALEIGGSILPRHGFFPALAISLASMLVKAEELFPGIVDERGKIEEEDDHGAREGIGMGGVGDGAAPSDQSGGGAEAGSRPE